MNKNADAVIIGGGILGASTLYYLAKMGLRNTILLEKGNLACGSSGDSAAMVRQHYSNEVSIRLVKESLRFFQNFADEFSEEGVFKQTGWIFLCPPDAKDSFDLNMDRLVRLGVRTNEISLDDAKELISGLNTDEIGSIAFEPDSGYADPKRTIGALVSRSEHMGAVVHTQTPATGLIIRNGRMCGVSTPEGNISTPIVINTAGPWAYQVGLWAGLELPLTISREQDIVIEPPEDSPTLDLVVSNMVDRTYFRPIGERSILAGVGHPKENEPADPNNYNREASKEFISDIVSRIEHRFPSLRGSKVTSSWAGLYTITPDWNTMVGPTPEIEGLFLGVGGSGHSFKLGPAIGMCLADLILQGSSSRIDISPLSPDRFSKGVPLRSTYGGNRG